MSSARSGTGAASPRGSGSGGRSGAGPARGGDRSRREAWGLGTRRSADGSLVIRPAGAVVLSVLVWVTCALLMAQALLVAGASALLLAPGPILVSVLIWALLWNPRVILPADGESVVVRNPVRTVSVPMAAIEDVRLGAMLRLRVADGAGEPRSRVITAWNAPGTGKDDHRDRLTTMGAEDRGRRGAARRTADLRGGSSRAGASARGASLDQRSGWAERLVRDQRASPSYAVVEAWETWRERHGEEARVGDEADGGRVSTRLNTAALALVAVSTALVVVRVLF